VAQLKYIALHARAVSLTEQDCSYHPALVYIEN